MEAFTEASFSAELDSRGRVTVPARIRKRLGLEQGDSIKLSLNSSKVLRREFSNSAEALEFVSRLEDVESFSFQDGVLEVIKNE